MYRGRISAPKSYRDKPALVTHDVEKILGRPAQSFADAVSAHHDLFTNH